MLDLFNRVYLAAWTGLRRQDGQTFVEYALIAVAVAGLAAAAAWGLGANISGVLDKINFVNPNS